MGSPGSQDHLSGGQETEEKGLGSRNLPGYHQRLKDLPLGPVPWSFHNHLVTAG